ncbi:hypothetical protein VNI00_010124 [Paramarasmius palmivorus]|uniref:F-box domain-containing protein n=1 Tax=Paramarasmius palmivorus TaxID=297713 RepID=A0AAW0CMG8_9AGAR
MSSSQALTLLDLPLELLIHILSYSPLQDLLSIQVTNRFLQHAIATSSQLQYLMALDIAGMEDNPKCSLPASDRLKVLEEREKAWKLFKPTFMQRVEIDKSQIILYELAGGAFIRSDYNRRVVNCVVLPRDDGSRQEDWGKLEVDEKIMDFGQAIEEHDLVAVITAAEKHCASNSATVEVKYYQFSTRQPHPLAGPAMTFTQNCPLEDVRVGIEISGDYVALVVKDSRPGHFDRDKIYVLDWKRSKIKTIIKSASRRYTSAIFISLDVILATNSYEGSLELWKIPAEPVAESTLPQLTLRLPALVPGFFVADLACRGAPNPSVTIPRNERPFRSSALDSIIVFHLTVSFINPAVTTQFLFFAHRSSLLKLLANSYSPPSEQGLGWAQWGRPITRWFHGRTITTDWITTTCGQRYVLISPQAHRLAQPVIVLDFNQHHCRQHRLRKESGENENHRVWLIDAPDNLHKLEVFREDVKGVLPYLATKSEEAYSFDGVLMDDERIIGLKRADFPAGLEAMEVMYFG